MSASLLKTLAAPLKPLKSRIRDWQARRVDRTQVFTTIYAKHEWAGQSVSGRGSDLDQTAILQQQLPLLFQQFGVHRLLDAPCGDFNWMQHVSLELDEYIGADIVAELIAINRQEHESANRRFLQLDIVSDSLPPVDLILCRDCLVHLSYRDIKAALDNFKRSNSTYLLTTTFPQLSVNHDIVTGEWRSLNLQAAPFHFPPPLFLLNEQCAERNHEDKSLGLWKLTEL